jgi:hypothetical protein
MKKRFGLWYKITKTENSWYLLYQN